MSNQIKFEVETKRVLEILSSQIYDSPLALLRENIQNAYDAILMRSKKEGIPLTEGKIAVSLDGQILKIQDNGIGMTEEVLRNNFWKAGSSGKHTQLASDAGVIGTFGIGAMANFGVASKLEIITRSTESPVTLKSIAKREDLSISEECISLEIINESRESGTEIIINIDDPSIINNVTSLNYLKAYVEYLPVAVLFNNTLISQKEVNRSIKFNTDDLTLLGTDIAHDNTFKASITVEVNKQGLIRAEITDVELKNNKISGSLLLSQGAGQIMGYRNFFGLAAIPVTSYFQLGGIVNLSFLTPTAGREALSRDSIA
jgi:molecular chaperone HtpG